MASSETVIGYHKLDTTFYIDHVQHITYHSDAVLGKRRVKVVQNWYRDQELGRGSFGTVFLERSQKGECRAVKDVSKERDSARTAKVDYRMELMAMAALAKHEDLFVQLFGWYESDHYIHIAMEYISYGNLRNYLKMERSESEAKAITQQLLEGLVVMHQERCVHRDLKPENIFVVSTSPIWVKIGDFGLWKLARGDSAFRSAAYEPGYSAPEMGGSTSSESSEYTNAVDIWALGCITHEMLTQVVPFPNLVALRSYCIRPEFLREIMLSKHISREGIEAVESMLALLPPKRIVAKEALGLRWLRLEGEAITVDIKDRRSADWYSDALSDPKPSTIIDPGLKRYLGQVLEEIHKSTSSPDKPKLREKGAVQMLLTGGIDRDIRDSAGNTPLHIAVRRSSLSFPVARFNSFHALVDSGADIEAKNSQGETPLFLAVSRSSAKDTRKLLELGASVEAPNLDGIRPLMKAVRLGNKTLVELLLGQGAFVGSILVEQEPITPLHVAAQLESDVICQLILREKADVNARDFLQQTPLHKAARGRRLSAASSLISAGADIEARDVEERTPLYYAVAGNSVPLAKLLLVRGADSLVLDKSGISLREVAERANAPGMAFMFDTVRVTR